MINYRTLVLSGAAVILLAGVGIGIYYLGDRTAKEDKPSLVGSTVSPLPSGKGTTSSPDVLDPNSVVVSTSQELVTALASAKPGVTIVLNDGQYTMGKAFTLSGKQGTESSPITIRAANNGKAEITEQTALKITNSSYVVVQGLKFSTKGQTLFTVTGSHHIRITRNIFASPETQANTKTLDIYGNGTHDNWIDRNEFGPKKNPGPVLAVNGGNGQMSKNDRIEYNYFHDIGPRISNGKETIRLGLGDVSMSAGNAAVQYNLFERCDGDPEVISVKSSNNEIRYNTVRDSMGQITLRHGNGSSVYGNFFLGSGKRQGEGGIRIYGNDQKIYNNYFQNLTAEAINIDGGDFDGGEDGKNYTQDDLGRHWRNYRTQVVHNTIVDSYPGIIVGKSYTYEPVDARVANNIVTGSKGPLYDEPKQTNTVFEGNIGFGATISSKPRTGEEILSINPLLVAVNSLVRPGPGSPVKDKAVGVYPFITDDMDGQSRTGGIPDTGADEIASTTVKRFPLKPSDVGPNAL